MANLERVFGVVRDRTVYAWLRRDLPGARWIYPLVVMAGHVVLHQRCYCGSRVVEVPRVLEEARQYANGRSLQVLEMGDVLSEKLVMEGHHVHLVDMDAWAAPGPRLTIFKDDIRNVTLPVQHFDIAISISTLEHIGVAEPTFGDGDLLSVAKIYEALHPGGLFLMTVPFGRPSCRMTTACMTWSAWSGWCSAFGRGLMSSLSGEACGGYERLSRRPGPWTPARARSRGR